MDYGYGTGTFVRTVNSLIKFEKVIGLDLWKDAISICNEMNKDNHNVEFYSTSDYEKDFNFDCIVSLEVLEHIPNPEETVKYFKNNLRDGGILFLSVPNYNSFEQRVFKSNWRLWCPPEHINYFTIKSLSKLLVKNGFKIEFSETKFVYSFSFGIREKVKSRVIVKILTQIKKYIYYKIPNIILKIIGYQGGKLILIAKKTNERI